jgi:hypothetical protein
MRFTLAAFMLMGGLALVGPAHPQGTVSPSVAPKQPTAPPGHRQPRPNDVTTGRMGTEPPPAAPAADPARPDPNDPDERLNRILNGICRGC